MLGFCIFPPDPGGFGGKLGCGTAGLWAQCAVSMCGDPQRPRSQVPHECAAGERPFARCPGCGVGNGQVWF